MSEPQAGPSPAGYGECDRRAEQETADGVEMMERLRAAGPDSAMARHLRNVLLSYAFGELMKLHQADKLLTRVKSQLPISLPAPPDDWRRSAEGLIYLSVKQSLERFVARAVFGDGSSRWRPNGGASIKTYFINKCLYTFKDLYLEEHKKRGSVEILCSDIAGEEAEMTRFLHSVTPEDPESRAVDADQIRRIGRKMTPQEAQIVLGKYYEKTNEEIGRDVSKSDEAVSSSLQRLRRRLQNGVRGTQ